MVEMTKIEIRSGDGAPMMMGTIFRVFTDGDLSAGCSNMKVVVHLQMIDVTIWSPNDPHVIDASATLQESSDLFKETHVDTLVVKDNGQVIGMLDIQDLLG